MAKRRVYLLRRRARQKASPTASRAKAAPGAGILPLRSPGAVTFTVPVITLLTS
jgi:hypothetical protein